MQTIIDQKDAFSDGEGDVWFARNKGNLMNKGLMQDLDCIKNSIGPYKNQINSILEIGCSNGRKLEELSSFFDAFGYGLDPSSAAINDAKARVASNAKDLHFQVGKSVALPYADAKFDLVFFGFCLYLVDRDEIFRTIAEADRVLKKGGFLVILDFDPAKQHKRPYIHKEGLFSFKTSYADFFLNNGHYYLVAKESFSHAAHYFSINSDERVSTCILFKELDAY